MIKDKKEWVLIVERANTKVHSILKTCVINGFTKEWAKNEIELLIKQIIADFEKEEAPEELISKTTLAIKLRFANWYSLIINDIEKKAISLKNSWLAKTYESITGKQLKQTKGLVIENDGYKQGSIDNPRQYVTTQERAEGQAYYKDYRKVVEENMAKISNKNLTLKNKDKILSLRNLAEMEARFDVQRQEIEKLKEDDIKYVVASTHINSSERCEIWQGKVFILDVDPNAQFIQNVDLSYKPKPKGKIERTDIDYYSLADAMEHGFLGYNCRHRLVKYTYGMNFFRQYSKEQIEKERALEIKQRYLERKIIEEKQKANISVDEEEKEQIEKNIYKFKKMYYNYCKDNGLTINEWRISIN